MWDRIKTGAAIFGILWIGVLVGAGFAFVGMNLGGGGANPELPSEQIENSSKQPSNTLDSETPNNESVVIKESELDTDVTDIHRIEVTAPLNSDRSGYKVVAEMIVPPKKGSGGEWYVAVGDQRKQLSRENRRVVFDDVNSWETNVTILRADNYGNVEVVRSVNVQEILQDPVHRQTTSDEDDQKTYTASESDENNSTTNSTSTGDRRQT